MIVTKKKFEEPKREFEEQKTHVVKDSKRLFWHLWTSYATYYFGRVNLSIVIPVLLATYGLSKYSLGLVSSGFFFAYAAGQFFHGQFSERFNPFVYIVIGLIGAAVMNLLLGFSGGFFWVLFILEIFNGLFQSMGWSSTVRAASLVSKDREKATCTLGTSYQVGNSIAWLVSSFAVGWFGWQWGFWVAAIFMSLRGITLLAIAPKVKIKQTSLKHQVKHTLCFSIIISGISLGLLNMIRYGVIVWIPTFLYEVQKASITSVGLKIFLIPIAGVLGTLTYNKLKINRDLLTIVYLCFLGLIFTFYYNLTGIISVVVLILSGFFVYGPHVFLVSTFPSRFCDKKIVAASAGFIDGIGYIGVVLIGVIVPFLLNWGWQIVFLFWAVLCVIMIVMILILYIYSKRKKEKIRKLDYLRT